MVPAAGVSGGRVHGGGVTVSTIEQRQFVYLDRGGYTLWADDMTRYGCVVLTAYSDEGCKAQVELYGQPDIAPELQRWDGLGVWVWPNTPWDHDRHYHEICDEYADPRGVYAMMTGAMMCNPDNGRIMVSNRRSAVWTSDVVLCSTFDRCTACRVRCLGGCGVDVRGDLWCIECALWFGLAEAHYV